jgi:cobalt-zinc-cadmium efflux system protein
VVLLGISIYVLFEAYQRFQNPPEVQSKSMLIVAGIGLLVNIVGMMILRKDSEGSLNMKGAYFEVLSDMLTSVGVMIAGVIMLTTGWYYADPLISAAIGLLIFPRTWRLLKEAINVLLEGTPKDVDIHELRQSLEQVPGVKMFMISCMVSYFKCECNECSCCERYRSSQNQLLKTLTDTTVNNFKISHTLFR